MYQCNGNNDRLTWKISSLRSRLYLTCMSDLGILSLGVGKVGVGVVILDPVLEGVGLGSLVLQGDRGVGGGHGRGLDRGQEAAQEAEESGGLANIACNTQ